jgi:hypothetical protein
MPLGRQAEEERMEREESTTMVGDGDTLGVDLPAGSRVRYLLGELNG